MSLSVNNGPQVPPPLSPAPIQADNRAEAMQAAFAAEDTLTDVPVDAPEAVEDSDETERREAAAFPPADSRVTFGDVQASADPIENVPVEPLKVDPPLADLSALENGRSVLRGDALSARMQELGTQTANGLTALSERKEQLSTALASLPPDSPERENLTQTIEHIQKAVDQLTELQGQLSSDDANAVAALQELLVKKDNGTVEDEPFEARLTYEKPDGSQATFDNLYGKRTDAGIRDYIARLVEETRTDGPHQQAEPPTQDAQVQPEDTEVVLSTTPEASLRAAADVPATAEEEIIVRPESATEVPEAPVDGPAEAPIEAPPAVSAPEPVVPLEEGTTPDAFNAVTTFLDTEPHGDVVSHFTALASEFSTLRNSGENAKANDVAEKLNLFMGENQETLAEFRVLYEKLGTAQREQIDGRILQGVQQFIEENPDLVNLSALPTTGGNEVVQLSSLYNMDWNHMGSTLYSGNTPMMA